MCCATTHQIPRNDLKGSIRTVVPVILSCFVDVKTLNDWYVLYKNNLSKMIKEKGGEGLLQCYGRSLSKGNEEHHVTL